jgi:hypothetical protein
MIFSLTIELETIEPETIEPEIIAAPEQSMGA